MKSVNKRTLVVALAIFAVSAVGSARADLTFTDNLAVWIDAENVTVDGGIVQSFVDQSGNNHDAVLNTGGPSVAANMINGYDAVYFGGGASLKCLDSLGLSGSNVTVFVVALRTGAIGTNQMVFSVGDIAGAGGDKIIAADYALGNYSTGLRYNAGFTQFGSPDYNTGEFGITTWGVQTGDTHADVDYWGNGTAGDIVGTPTSNVIDLTDGGYTVGAILKSDGTVGYGLSGYVVEMLIYTDVLTDAERNEVGSYLADKYNIDYVPEPATMACIGLGGMMMLIRRKKAK